MEPPYTFELCSYTHLDESTQDLVSGQIQLQALMCRNTEKIRLNYRFSWVGITEVIRLNYRFSWVGITEVIRLNYRFS